MLLHVYNILIHLKKSSYKIIYMHRMFKVIISGKQDYW